MKCGKCNHFVTDLQAGCDNCAGRSKAVQVEHYGKSNSSYGNWYIKFDNQTSSYFWRKKDMELALETLASTR